MLRKFEKMISEGKEVILEKSENGNIKYVKFKHEPFEPELIEISLWSHSSTEQRALHKSIMSEDLDLEKYFREGYIFSFYPYDGQVRASLIANMTKREPVYFYIKDYDEEGFPLYQYKKIEFVKSLTPKLYSSYFHIKEWSYRECSDDGETVIGHETIPSFGENRVIMDIVADFYKKGYNFFYGSELYKNGEEYFNNLIGIGD